MTWERYFPCWAGYFLLRALDNEIGIVLGCSEPDVSVVYWRVVCCVVFNEIGIRLEFSELNISVVS